jgi:hypothetical protein
LGLDTAESKTTQPGGPVQQPYSYSSPSPHRLFKNSSTEFGQRDPVVLLFRAIIKVKKTIGKFNYKDAESCRYFLNVADLRIHTRTFKIKLRKEGNQEFFYKLELNTTGGTGQT